MKSSFYDKLKGLNVKNAVKLIFKELGFDKAFYHINLSGIPDIDSYILDEQCSIKKDGNTVENVPDLESVVDNLKGSNIEDYVANKMEMLDTQTVADKYETKKQMRNLNSVVKNKNEYYVSGLRKNYGVEARVVDGVVDFDPIVSNFSDTVNVTPTYANEYLVSIGEAQLKESKRVADVVTRPDVKLSEVVKIVPRGTKLVESLKEDYSIIPDYNPSDICVDNDKINDSILNAMSILKFNQSLQFSPVYFNDYRNILFNRYVDSILECAEILVKYRGYIEREKQIADKIHRLENLTIPEGYDFDKVSGLSIECRQKLVKYAPRTIGQASRISGVSPSDVSVLLMCFGR